MGLLAYRSVLAILKIELRTATETLARSLDIYFELFDPNNSPYPIDADSIGICLLGKMLLGFECGNAQRRVQS